MYASLRCRCLPEGAETFVAVELAPELQAVQCHSCSGALLHLKDWQHWRIHSPQPLPVDPPSTPQDNEADARVRPCPVCARLMQRYRVTVEADFCLDRCAACQLVWFDRDEWAALADRGLSGQLRSVLSDAWQRQLRDDEVSDRREEALRARYGDGCIDELARIRSWLDAQPQRDELIALLRAGW